MVIQTGPALNPPPARGGGGDLMKQQTVCCLESEWESSSDGDGLWQRQQRRQQPWQQRRCLGPPGTRSALASQPRRTRARVPPGSGADGDRLIYQA